MNLTHKCKCVDLDLSNPHEFYGHFIFTSLNKGDSTTISNLVRRILLSNLYGVRITGVRVAGLNNEFLPLEGVREDFLEVLLNLKDIIFFTETGIKETYYGKLNVEGPAIITAGALSLPEEVKVLNPKAYLLTISDKSSIELEIKIEHGKSYVFAKDQKPEGLEDYIPIDSNFAPIVKVNSFISNLPQGIENTREDLHLEIFTNGTILPQYALIQARIMSGYLLSSITNIEFLDLNTIKSKHKILNFIDKSTKNIKVIKLTDQSSQGKEKLIKKQGSRKEKKIEVASPEENSDDLNLSKVDRMKNAPLKLLNLSNRIINALKKANLTSIWDLTESTPTYLKSIEGLGPKSVIEIKMKLDLFYQDTIDF
uniref:RNA polymerase subunit alpha n=1 Tax=Ascoseira mirabilis TaxID=76830 RepID=UPI0030010E53|nr:RNA polymerase subunit alpha [Ascoseira mirabilis]